MKSLSTQDRQILDLLSGLNAKAETLAYTQAMSSDYDSAQIWINNRKNYVQTEGVFARHEFQKIDDAVKVILKNDSVVTYAPNLLFKGVTIEVNNSLYLVTSVKATSPSLGTFAKVIFLNTTITYTDQEGHPVKGLPVRASIKGDILTISTGSAPQKDQLVCYYNDLYSPKYLKSQDSKITVLQLEKFKPEAKI